MTLEDFYAEVLHKLGVLAGEEAPSPSDRKTVKAKYEQVHAEYTKRQLTTWFDDEPVPDWVADAFATLVARRLVGPFSVPVKRRLEIKADAFAAESTVAGIEQRRVFDNEPPYFF